MPEAFSLGPLLLPTERVGTVLALLLALAVTGLLARAAGTQTRWIRGAADLSVLFGLLGARAGFVAMHWPVYAEEPWTALYLWQPGYTLWIGVVVGGGYALWRLAARNTARWQHALPLLGGFAAGGLMLAGIHLGLHFPQDDSDVLRPESRVAGPTLQSLLGTDVRARVAGDRVPPFAMQDLEGTPTAFSDLAGRAVVLNFWATWCAPCRREIPLLDEMHARFADSGLTVLGVALGEPADRVGAFIQQLGAVYPVWVDPPGTQVSVDLADRFGAVGLPTTFFIDREGVIRDVAVGELARAPLVVKIQTLLQAEG